MNNSKEAFLRKANHKHGDKYDYSKIEYINNSTKVCIGCKTHGDFWQIPSDHTRGRGCPKCSRMKDINVLRNDFLKKAVKIHGDKYGYDKVKYVNNKTKVTITCLIHGDFQQTPNMHLSKNGCPKCNSSYKLDYDSFVKKSNLKHRWKYDYSSANYVNVRTKVCIICPDHGEFWQTPSNHMNGQGCPRCKIKGQSELYMKLKNKYPNENFEWEFKSDWLGKQAIDIYLEKYKIAIEYDGLQHYLPIEFYGGKQGLEIRQAADRRKEQKCIDNNVVLYRVLYGTIEECFEKLCDKINERIANYENLYC